MQARALLRLCNDALDALGVGLLLAVGVLVKARARLLAEAARLVEERDDVALDDALREGLEEVGADMQADVRAHLRTRICAHLRRASKYPPQLH